MPLRAHLESAERQGFIQPRLIGPPLPEELAYLWRWFLDLHSGRSLSGWGPTRATHLDIMAWQANTGIKAEPWEISILSTLGVVWMNAQGEQTSTAPPLIAGTIARANKRG